MKTKSASLSIIYEHFLAGDGPSANWEDIQ
jgi:hypothetical protein